MQSFSTWQGWLSVIAFSGQAVFLLGVSFHAYVPLLPFFGKELGINAAGIGVASACLQIGWLIALPGQPWLREHLGAKYLVDLSLGFFICAPLFFISAQKLAGLCVCRAFEGTGLALLTPTVDTYLTKKAPEASRGTAFGATSICFSLGTCFGIIASVYLYPQGGIPLVMFIICAIGVSILLANNVLLSKDWFEDSCEKALLTPRRRFEALQHVDMVLLFVLHFTTCFVRAFVFVVIPLYMSYELEFTMVMVAMIWFLADSLVVPAGLLGGYVADALDPFHVIIIACIVQGLLLSAISVPSLTSSISPHQYSHAGLIILFVIWMPINCTRSAFLNPAYSKLATMTCVRRVYNEFWVVSHFLSTIAWITGGLVGGFAYGLVNFHILIRSCTAIVVVVTAVVGLSFPYAVKDVASQAGTETETEQLQGYDSTPLVIDKA